jgi:Protein of unknown function (DUF3604)
VLAAALAAACGEPPPADPAAARLAAAEREIDTRLGVSRDAKLEIYKSMRADMTAPRHPADGGGRAWIASVQDAEGRRVALHAGDRVRIRLIYEAGALGIAVHGALRLRVPPFWQWDPPQPFDRDAPGYTEVAVTETGPHPELGFDRESRTLAIKFSTQPLLPQERIYITYGAGPALAGVDIYAEHGERLWFSVDGDGDGVHSFIADSPPLDIAAGPPALLRVVLPTTARPGERVPIHVSVLDQHGNTGVPFTGEVRLSAPHGLELPKAIGFSAPDQGRRTVEARAVSAGVFRATATVSPEQIPGGVREQSNPLIVEPEAPHLYWADLHGHSQLSDGSGTPEEYFTYARDVSGLDAAALTDHDHFGMRFLDEDPALWERIRQANARFNEPGRFVTVLGYEWTSLLHGHRHVLYFDDGDRTDGPDSVLSAFDVRYQTPQQLWDALRGRPVLTFAHHSAGGPISTNWRYRPDPELEPVTEIASVHGSSEAPDAPKPIYAPVAGNFVRDALDDGIRLGFIGSGDSHAGQPGYSYRGMPLGAGLAAIRAEALTRDEIRRAMLARRVYATNGARIFLTVSIDGAPMGSLIAAAAPPASETPESVLRIRVVAEAPLERVDFVTGGRVTSEPLDGALEWSNERAIPRLRRGDYHYVRVIQRDGGAAWSSPIFAD